jgi:hypothetical protein
MISGGCGYEGDLKLNAMCKTLRFGPSDTKAGWGLLGDWNHS